MVAYFEGKKLKKIGHKKVEKPPSKVAQKYSIFFSPSAAKTAPKEYFMFQNVAYRPTVYKTGLTTGLWSVRSQFSCAWYEEHCLNQFH